MIFARVRDAQTKYSEAISSSSTWKLLWFEIIKMFIAVLKNKCIVLFIIIFGTLSFHMNSENCQISRPEMEMKQGFMTHSTQNRSFGKRSFQSISGLGTKN